MIMITKACLFHATISLLQDNATAFSFVATETTKRSTIVSSSHTDPARKIRFAPEAFPTPSALFSSSNGGEDDKIESDDNSNDEWQIALQQRQLSFRQQRDETKKRWLFADCQQTAVGLPDWVRRVDVQWPLAACGSAGGDVYVVNCETGAILGKGQSEADQRRYADVPISDSKLASALKQLYGDFDGGGTLSIGISWNNIVAHAGRDGGVQFWKIDTEAAASSISESGTSSDNPLISQGTLLEGELVTSLIWVEDDLWIGTQDGRVLLYTIDDDELPSEATQAWKELKGTILSLSYNEELDVTVATTSNGFVELLTVDEPDCRRSFYPPFDSGRMSSPAFPLCSTIVEEEQQQETTNDSIQDSKRRFAIACGGNDGSLYLQPLRLLDDTIDPELDLERPFSDSVIRSLVPTHRGPCKCMVSPFPGIVSALGLVLGHIKLSCFNFRLNCHLTLSFPS